MQIEVKPEEIDQYVKDAIINSTVGKIISEKVASNMKDIIERRWDNPIDILIKSIIRETVQDILKQPENTAIITKAVQNHFTAEHVQNVIYKTLDRL